MERDPHGAFAHAQANRRFLRAHSFYGDEADNVTLALVQPLQHPFDIVAVEIVGLAFGPQRLAHALDRDLGPEAPPSLRVDQLVVEDGGDPRADRTGRLPCRPLQVDREEDVLDDVLGIRKRHISSIAEPPSDGPQVPSQCREKPAVLDLVAQTNETSAGIAESLLEGFAERKEGQQR